MRYDEVMLELKALANSEAVAGMARFGINPENTYGISIPALRGLARKLGKDHALAQQLWGSAVHEARILASMIDDPQMVTEEQMERWVADFDSWDVCDQCCLNLLSKTAWAYPKCREWSGREEEFVKRAGFALMACLAWQDKKAADQEFIDWLPIIKLEAADSRNFVRKAVNWALRQIGKRNQALNRLAIQAAEEIIADGSKSARWVGADALRELSGPAVQARLRG